MATKAKKPAAKKAESATTVTRITATDSKPKAQKEKPIAKASATAEKPKNQEGKKNRNPLRAIGEYFAGAWFELREVRWPNRRATWGLTVAVLAFTAFFIVLILLLDALFKYLFQLILG